MLKSYIIENIKLFSWIWSYRYKKTKSGIACKQVFLAAATSPQTCGFNGIKLFPLHLFVFWSLVEYFRLFAKSEGEQTLLVCAACSVSDGEDIGLEWKLLYIMCSEEC